eukprot:TRINITY_DN13761_c0_g1_i4.p1 TRINITY_DN13761_c0_g1~~TRINITY_DN13761_c0_g1_i4.p1  ORF type:complete len:356 (+),score=42.21 TRINITY_DN13761_c0_g1_i4:64-1131(+)
MCIRDSIREKLTKPLHISKSVEKAALLNDHQNEYLAKFTKKNAYIFKDCNLNHDIEVLQRLCGEQQIEGQKRNKTYRNMQPLDDSFSFQHYLNEHLSERVRDSISRQRQVRFPFNKFSKDSVKTDEETAPKERSEVRLRVGWAEDPAKRRQNLKQYFKNLIKTNLVNEGMTSNSLTPNKTRQVHSSRRSILNSSNIASNPDLHNQKGFISPTLDTFTPSKASSHIPLKNLMSKTKIDSFHTQSTTKPKSGYFKDNSIRKTIEEFNNMLSNMGKSPARSETEEELVRYPTEPAPDESIYPHLKYFLFVLFDNKIRSFRSHFTIQESMSSFMNSGRKEDRERTVSYTHLTLPTIYSV